MSRQVDITASDAIAASGSRFFFGWYVVGACFVVLFVMAGIGFYAFSAFFAPLQKEFGWSRAEISLGVSIASLVSGLGGPLVGRLTDTIGPRKVLITGGIILGACIAALGFVNSLFTYYVVFFLSSFGRAAASMVPVGAVIGNWFIRRRGLASGIAATGVGLGGFFMASLSAYLISITGWRLATIILGIAAIVLIVPVVAIWIRKSPAEKGLVPLGHVSEQSQTSGSATSKLPQTKTYTLSQALKTLPFWLISMAFFLNFVGQSSMLLHAVPYFMDQGESAQTAAAFLSMLAGLGVIGKLSMGYIADKIPPRMAMGITFTLQALAFVVILLPKTPITVPAFIALYGIGMGGVAALMTVIVAATFGIRSLGAILGGVSVLSTLSNFGSPVLTGYIYDSTHSYTLAFVLFLVAEIGAVVAVLLARPEKAVVNAPQTSVAH